MGKIEEDTDASCLIKNNPNIIKELREIFPYLQIIFESDDNDIKKALKANVKEFAKSIMRDKKEKEAEENLRESSSEKDERLEKEIKILFEEKEVLAGQVEILAEENKILTDENQRLNEEKDKLKKHMRREHAHVSKTN